MINHQIWRSLSLSLSLWKQAKMAKFGQAWILLWAQHFTKTSSQNWVDSGGDLKTPRNPVAENDVPMKIACFMANSRKKPGV